MEMMHTSTSEVQDQIINFQKQQIWKEKRHDYLSMWLEIEKLEQDVEKFNDDEIERENSIHKLLLWCRKQEEFFERRRKRDEEQQAAKKDLENLA